jgi:hypothetical protein
MKRKQYLYFVLLTISPPLLCTPSVTFAQWEPDVRLTYNDSASYTPWNNARCIAASGDTVHTVWFDWRNGHSNPAVYYKRSTDGGTTWGADTRLTDLPPVADFPSLAVSGCTVHVVCVDWRDGNYEIYYKHSTDGGSVWGPDVRLSNNPSNSIHPSVTASGSSVHVVWNDYRNGNDEIYYNRSTDGGTTWDGDIRLTNNLDVSWPASVAAFRTNVHVVWNDTRSGNWEVFYKRSTDGGTTWKADTQLTNNNSSSMYAAITVLGPNAHVVWVDGRDGNDEIYYKRSTDGGTNWGADTRLTNASSSSEFPSVAVSGSCVHVTWYDQRDGNNEIYYKRSTDGGASWGTDTRLTNNPSSSEFPSLAISGNYVHMIWDDQRDGNREIYYKRNPTGNSGVEGSTSSATISHFPFSICPNPFTSFARVPGHSTDRFALYDVSGRRVGVYKGDRIGEGLRAGVYFLRANEGKGKPVRIVKIR